MQMIRATPGGELTPRIQNQITNFSRELNISLNNSDL